MPKQQQKPKHLVIVAGEASGDLHAASLVRALKQSTPDLHITGVGGQHMQAAGVELVDDLANSGGVTGLLEVLKHFKPIKRAYRAIQQHLKTTKPDVLLLVDYPGFNLRLADYAKKHLGLTILYYISPQLWAWKPGRIKRIQASVDHMAVIFPFEKAIYEAAHVPVSFVGHPLTKTLPSNTKPPSRKHFHLPDNKRILAVLPGSRVNEVERHMPILYQTACRLIKKHSDLHVVIPIADTLALSQIKRFWKDKTVPCTFIQHQKAVDVARVSDAIVVASGTASLECALLEKPMCIIYKVGFVSYLAASVFLRVQYVGLCNLLTHRMSVPELLQYDFNPDALTEVLTKLLEKTPTPLQKGIIAKLSALKQSLSTEQADSSLPDLVLSLLDREKKLLSCQRMA
ncbi:MAG: lipid-A-disaccharide synthase [Legionellaceae bacterium]|nr:lipid-A-disaccharide synthase [Legionellaceae bacterium]